MVNVGKYTIHGSYGCLNDVERKICYSLPVPTKNQRNIESQPALGDWIRKEPEIFNSIFGQKEMAPQSDFLGIMNQNGLGNKGIGSIFWHPICKRRVVKKKAIKLRNSSKFFIAKKVFESMISFFESPFWFCWGVRTLETWTSGSPKIRARACGHVDRISKWLLMVAVSFRGGYASGKNSEWFGPQVGDLEITSPSHFEGTKLWKKTPPPVVDKAI